MKQKISLAIIIIILLISTSVKSQIVSGGNLALGIPVGSLSNVYPFGLGFDVYAGCKFYKDMMQAGLGFGYIYLISNGDGKPQGISFSDHVVPISLYYSFGFPIKKFKPFIRLEFEMYIHNQSTTLEGKGTYNQNVVSLGLAPSLGTEYKISNKLSVFGAFEMNIANYKNYIGINLGAVYTFSVFKKKAAVKVVKSQPKTNNKQPVKKSNSKQPIKQINNKQPVKKK